MSLWVATYFLLSYWSHVTCILEVMQCVIYKGWPSPDLDQSIKQVQFNNKFSFFLLSKLQILLKPNENIFGIFGLQTSSLWSPFISESFAWLLKLIFWYCEIFRCGARPQINGFQGELRAAEEAMTCSKCWDFGNFRLLPLNCLQALLRLYPSEGSAFYGDIVLMSNMRFFGSEIQQIAEPPWFNEDRQCVLRASTALRQ